MPYASPFTQILKTIAIFFNFVVLFFCQPSAFQHISGAKSALNTPLTFFKMTVYSISTGTLCGECIQGMLCLFSTIL